MQYGPIVDIDLKLPPGYAFIEYEDSGDAEDEIYYRDGYNFDGYRLRVELAHGGRGNLSSADHHGSYGGSGNSRAAPKHSDYRGMCCLQYISFQLYKVFRDVLFSQVFRDRGGMTRIVDYAHCDDMKYAIKKLDDSEFPNAFSRSYVRVREYDSRWSYSRSRSRDSRRSYSRSPYMLRSPSRSRSYSGRSGSISPKRKYSHPSPSVSGSRSVLFLSSSSGLSWGCTPISIYLIK
ncbi:hypothetical protein ACB092_11G067400 [Castanea dentata]